MVRHTRTMLFRTIVVGVVLTIVIGVWMVHQTLEGVRNSYAVWWVADLVVVYMETNENRWPRNWDDLREPYTICTGRSGAPWTFEELQSRVDVDWQADPTRLAKQSSFRVIWLKDGSDAHWESRNPNTIIREYLQTPAAVEINEHASTDSQKPRANND